MARQSTTPQNSPRVVASESVRRGSPVRFFQDTIAELRKAVWPTRQETIRLTYTVILIAGVIAVILGVLDYVFSQTLTRFVINN